MVMMGDAERLPGGALALTIEATSLGMTAQQLSCLFQPFEPLGRETSGIEGTGLGLIITRSLIEAMGGRMDIHSQPGAGTRIGVVLPMCETTADQSAVQPGDSRCPTLAELGSVQASASREATHVENAQQKSAPMRPALPDSTTPLSSDSQSTQPLRVLYVEDNRINALLFEEALRPFPQIDLEVAEDGQTALTMAGERVPDVLVLDAHLPGMSGFDVLRALRKLPHMASTPAFMCSADAMPDDLARAKAAGFTGYWTKPIDILAVTRELCKLAADAGKERCRTGDNPGS